MAKRVSERYIDLNNKEKIVSNLGMFDIYSELDIYGNIIIFQFLIYYNFFNFKFIIIFKKTYQKIILKKKNNLVQSILIKLIR